MINICFNCGVYRPDKIIDSAGPYAICPECNYRHAFLQLPLLVVSGASGTGKSTICQLLLGNLNEVVLLDSDILWRAEFNKPENNHREFFETWLRVCKNIAQSGRPVVLFGAGLGVAENLEPCIERRYFSVIHYLALTCQDEVLTERLRARPQWRASNDITFLNQQVHYNQWLQANARIANPAIHLVDTTTITIEETAMQVAAWIRQRI
jgi:predicted kinase